MTQTKPQSNSWSILLYIAGFIASLYGFQLLLQTAFYSFQSDDISLGLRPFQNHYLSFSKYYLTTEGSVSEFTSDMTGVGRLVMLLITDVFIVIFVMVPLYFIKPLRKYYSPVFWSFVLLLVAISFYSGFFVPQKKTTFEGKEMVFEKTEWIFKKNTARINTADIEKFEYDFLKEVTSEEGTSLYSQIFIVVGGKRFLIGENQLVPENDLYKPTPAQVLEVQKAIEALEKLIVGK